MTPTATSFNAKEFGAALFGGASAPAGIAGIVQVGHGLLYPALRKAGVTLGPGRTPSAAQFQDAFDELNRLINSLDADRMFIYAQDIQQFPLAPNQIAYTIGQNPLAQSPADFNVPRPAAITEATVIASSGWRQPLAIMTDQAWANVQQMQASIGWMAGVYYDRASPIGTIYLWGQPSMPMTLELYIWHTVPKFSNLTDVVLLPEGYEDALVLNLAVRLAPQFQRAVDPDVRNEARLSLMRVLSNNSPMPIAMMPAGVACGCDGVDGFGGAGSIGGGGGTGGGGSTLYVATVFGRSGNVTAQAGDYTAAQVGAASVTRQIIAGPGLTGGGALSADVTLAAAVTSVFGRTGAVVLTLADVTGVGAVANTRQVIAGAGLAGGGALSADVTVSLAVFGASGAGHKSGGVPDPGATAGTTKFLREDASWAVPAGGGGLTDPTTTLGDLLVRGSAAVGRLGVGPNGQVLTADSTQTLGVKWAVAGAASQTPWGSDIDAASHKLMNASAIGIGVNPTSYDLHLLKASGYTQVMIENTAGTSDTGIIFKDANRQYKLGINVGTTGASKLCIYDLTGSGGRVWLDTAGNLGVGQASPAARLQGDVGTGATSAIAGFFYGATQSGLTFAPPLGSNKTSATLVVGNNGPDAGYSVLNCWSTGHDAILYVRGDNRVGIGGQLTPFDALHIAGAARIAGAVNSGGVANSFALDFFGGTSRLMSYGPNTSTGGGFIFYGMRSDGSSPVGNFSIDAAGYVKISLPVYADDASAGTGGVPSTGLYQDSSHVVRVKV